MAVDGGRAKRKQQQSGEDDEAGSPGGLLTMAGMQALLATHLSTQTRELQAHQTVEIGKAVKAMEERTTRQIEHVWQEIQKEMRSGYTANADAIDKLRDSQEALQKRLAALENREPSTVASTDAGEVRRQAIILGDGRGTPRGLTSWPTLKPWLLAWMFMPTSATISSLVSAVLYAFVPLKGEVDPWSTGKCWPLSARSRMRESKRSTWQTESMSGLLSARPRRKGKSPATRRRCEDYCIRWDGMLSGPIRNTLWARCGRGTNCLGV